VCDEETSIQTRKGPNTGCSAIADDDDDDNNNNNKESATS
jgi:hypothetical protein